MRLPVENELPIVFSGERVFVFLAQKAQVVGADQLGDFGGVVPELDVVEPDGLLVLPAALNRLLLLVALHRSRQPGCGNGEREQKQKSEKDGRQQHNARLRIIGEAGFVRGL